jgi:hypothetical protein
MKTARLLTISAALLMGHGVAHAIPVLFDLEEQPNTGDSSFFTSLSMTKMGFTMTITRPSDHTETSAFDIVDFSGLSSRPASWGACTLEPSSFQVDWDTTIFFWWTSPPRSQASRRNSEMPKTLMTIHR